MKKIGFVIGSMAAVLMIIILGFMGLSDKTETKNVEKRVSEVEEKTITCVSSEKKDDVEQTEIVWIKNKVLMTRTNISTWNKESANDQTCKYYHSQTEKLNSLPGIESSVDCNAYSGTATTIYTISEVDRTNIKLKQFEYLGENDTFDDKSWKNYMRKNHYSCTEK